MTDHPSSSGMTPETRRALGWLVVAIVFFGLVVWWRSDQLFGGPQPAQPRKGDARQPEPTPAGKRPARKQAAQKPAPQQPAPQKPYEPVRSDDPNAPRVAVTVVDDRTGKPIAGARVMVLDRGGRVLADEKTTASGSVEARPTEAQFRGVAAWHEDYAAGSTLASAGPLEIRLAPVTFLEFDIGDLHPARKAWFEVSRAGIVLRYSRTEANPVQANDAFLRFKLCEHLGLLTRRWPLTSNPARVPRYLPFDLQAILAAKATLPNHLDVSGMRALTPPDLSPREATTLPLQVAKDSSGGKLVAPPNSVHALEARYRLKPEDRGVLMLHLQHLDDDPNRNSYGEPITAKPDYSTFEEVDGTATFQVFDLPKVTVYPTVILFPPSGQRRMIRCNPVELDGLTRADLEPLQPGKLTIELSGASKDAEIHILDSRCEPFVNIGPSRRDGDTLVLSRLEPITYRIVAQSKTHGSRLHLVRVAPGGERKLGIEMQPAKRVDLLVKEYPAAIRVRDKATGAVFEYRADLFTRYFDFKPEGEPAAGVVRFKGLRHELFLAYGEYEIECLGGEGKPDKVVPLKVTGETGAVTLY